MEVTRRFLLVAGSIKLRIKKGCQLTLNFTRLVKLYGSANIFMSHNCLCPTPVDLQHLAMQIVKLNTGSSSLRPSFLVC